MHWLDMSNAFGSWMKKRLSRLRKPNDGVENAVMRFKLPDMLLFFCTLFGVCTVLDFAVFMCPFVLVALLYRWSAHV